MYTANPRYLNILVYDARGVCKSACTAFESSSSCRLEAVRTQVAIA